MNHQVEDHVDIERARGEHAQPVDLEEHRLGQQRDGGPYRRIEALEMADLDHTSGPFGNADDLISFGQ